MHMPGITGILFLIVLAVLLFGPSKLPELGRAAGKTLKEFKNATQGVLEEQPATTKSVELADYEEIEREIRMKVERELVEKEIREKVEQERKQQKKLV